LNFVRAGLEAFVAHSKTDQERKGLDQTGHQNLNTVHGYNRINDKWKKPASAKLGL
jgi:hypothetical protein